MKRDELARLLESNWFIKYHYLGAVRQVRMHYYERKRVQSSRGMFRDKITLRPSLINWRGVFNDSGLLIPRSIFFRRYFVSHKEVREKK